MEDTPGPSIPQRTAASPPSDMHYAASSFGHFYERQSLDTISSSSDLSASTTPGSSGASQASEAAMAIPFHESLTHYTQIPHTYMYPDAHSHQPQSDSFLPVHDRGSMSSTDQFAGSHYQGGPVPRHPPPSSSPSSYATYSAAGQQQRVGSETLQQQIQTQPHDGTFTMWSDAPINFGSSFVTRGF